MPVETLTALQESSLATTLRTSVWAYPIVNVGHVLGIALLFGAILPFDLRLIGLWRWIPIGQLARVLVPVSVAGLVLALGTGSLLFSVHALKYAGTTLFRVKLLLIACAVINALLLRTSRAWASRRETAFVRALPRLRVAGWLSMGLWAAVIVCGRMLGYL